MVDYDDVLDEIEREEKVDSAANYLEKVKKIKSEETRLKKLFRGIDENKKKLVYSTIADVAFMTITMRDLRETIIICAPPPWISSPPRASRAAATASLP